MRKFDWLEIILCLALVISGIQVAYEFFVHPAHAVTYRVVGFPIYVLILAYLNDKIESKSKK